MSRPVKSGSPKRWSETRCRLGVASSSKGLTASMWPKGETVTTVKSRKPDDPLLSRGFCWSGRRDSNPRPSPWQGEADRYLTCPSRQKASSEEDSAYVYIRPDSSSWGRLASQTTFLYQRVARSLVRCAEGPLRTPLINCAAKPFLSGDTSVGDLHLSAAASRSPRPPANDRE